MKKIVCILMAVITALSLAACGASPETNEPNPGQKPSQNVSESASSSVAPSSTKPAEPEVPNLNMFVGDWAFLQTDGNASDETFTINADGTMEKDGKIYSWKYRTPDWDDDFELKLTAYLMVGQEGYNPNGESYNHGYTIKFTRTEEDTYTVTSRNTHEFYSSERWSFVEDNLGGETHTCEITFYELVGAEAIIGRAYIPVAK